MDTPIDASEEAQQRLRHLPVGGMPVANFQTDVIYGIDYDVGGELAASRPIPASASRGARVKFPPMTSGSVDKARFDGTLGGVSLLDPLVLERHLEKGDILSYRQCTGLRLVYNFASGKLEAAFAIDGAGGGEERDH
ncbi:hypothetical protein NKJ10_25520 [Mesorhizobium sp. M0204]|uniref:hypothetical protein n=1 Tax=Mesorhizobium sp. M0204 TaxID=2956913 RepID=UPI003338D55F